MSIPKVLISSTKIRFQDCDPFNHLNNGRYIDYYINQREDQVLEAYGIDIFKMIREQDLGWVVSNTQLAYIKPVFTMEEIVFESQLLNYSPKHLQIEMRMYNKDKTQLKSACWMSFVHFNISKNKVENHSQDLLDLFAQVMNPVKETTFEEREVSLRRSN